MTSLSSLIRAKAIEHKELIEKWEKKELSHHSLQRPEERASIRIVGDVQNRGIISRGVGKEFGERAKITKRDADRFALIYSMGQGRFKAEVKRKLIPIMKRGCNWESSQSKKLRQQYFEKSDRIFGVLDNCELNTEFFSDGATIEICSVTSKTSEHLEFCSAAGIVDKKPRKRRAEPSGDAVFFKELFQRGEHAALFGVFDGLAGGKDDESKAPSFAIKILNEYVDKIGETKNAEELKELLVKYANEADATINESMGDDGGTTASIGVIIGKRLTYLNIGDSRTYALSLTGVPIVKKITTDDGISGAIERGARLSLSEFMQRAEYPYLYLGSFNKRITTKYGGGGVLHEEFNLRAPNVGTVDLDNYDVVFGITDGVWKHLPMNIDKRALVSDANCELSMSEIIRTSGCKGPKDVVEILHNYATSKMNTNGRAVKIKDNRLLVSIPQDTGVLAMTI